MIFFSILRDGILEQSDVQGPYLVDSRGQERIDRQSEGILYDQDLSVFHVVIDKPELRVVAVVDGIPVRVRRSAFGDVRTSQDGVPEASFIDLLPAVIPFVNCKIRNNFGVIRVNSSVPP
jgi:hypothetical protein